MAIGLLSFYQKLQKITTDNKIMNVWDISYYLLAFLLEECVCFFLLLVGVVSSDQRFAGHK